MMVHYLSMMTAPGSLLCRTNPRMELCRDSYKFGDLRYLGFQLFCHIHLFIPSRVLVFGLGSICIELIWVRLVSIKPESLPQHLLVLSLHFLSLIVLKILSLKKVTNNTNPHVVVGM